MTLLFDRDNLFNCTDLHEFKMGECIEWVKHYNFLLSCEYNNPTILPYYDEIRQYRCYDV